MITLIDLGADQCVPCKMMAPILSKLRKDYKDKAAIVVIGVICALLGRLLGDIGSWCQILIGAVLIWVVLGMLGVENAPCPAASSTA